LISGCGRGEEVFGGTRKEILGCQKKERDGYVYYVCTYMNTSRNTAPFPVSGLDWIEPCDKTAKCQGKIE
jgi:hypothetical protein